MHIGFVSTRLAGLDGVSLETAKWATVLERMGHRISYCAGELSHGVLVPEMHFRDPEAEWIYSHAFGTTEAHPDLGYRIERRAAQLKEALRAFVAHNDVELIIAENALAIPMQIPLGVALAEFIAETGIPIIAHHHDFWWERERFSVNCIPDYLDEAFPPDLPSIRHVVINSIALRELKARRGIEATIVPNVFDFAAPQPKVDEFNADFRRAIGLEEGDVLFLQPTRVIPRKGIELSIELVRRMRDSRCRLVITHQAGDEGMDYLYRLQTLAKEEGVDIRYIADRIGPARGTTPSGEKIYSLWDAYLHADLVTYPSLYEGFGNALLEAVYFKKPVLINRYPVYLTDISPLGFDFIEIDGEVTDDAVAQVKGILSDEERRQAMVEHNFRLGYEHFSYEVLEDKLKTLLMPI
jgi:glycosyltransferase involved in cell wall biosynthesis